MQPSEWKSDRERERERSERKRKGILEPVAFTFTDHKDYTYYPFYMIAWLLLLVQFEFQIVSHKLEIVEL